MELEELKNYLYVSIISAENEEFTEEQKQEVIKRYDEAREINTYNWEYILQPVDDTGKLVELFKC